MSEYPILSVYKTGKHYKPIIYATKGKQTKCYKFFTASEQGFQERQRALEFGMQQLKAGRFL